MLNKAQKQELKRAYDLIDQAKSILEDTASELAEDIGDKSDKWRESEKGEEAQAEHDHVEDAANSCDSALDSLGTIEGLHD